MKIEIPVEIQGNSLNFSHMWKLTTELWETPPEDGKRGKFRIGETIFYFNRKSQTEEVFLVMAVSRCSSFPLKHNLSPIYEYFLSQ